MPQVVEKEYYNLSEGKELRLDFSESGKSLILIIEKLNIAKCNLTIEPLKLKVKAQESSKQDTCDVRCSAHWEDAGQIINSDEERISEVKTDAQHPNFYEKVGVDIDCKIEAGTTYILVRIRVLP